MSDDLSSELDLLASILEAQLRLKTTFWKTDGNQTSGTLARLPEKDLLQNWKENFEELLEIFQGKLESELLGAIEDPKLKDG